MNKFLFETERIGFSAWCKDDFGLASALWGNPEVMKLLSLNGYYTKSQVQERLDREVSNFENYGIQYWKLYEKVSLNFIGCCGFKPCESREGGLEFGFQLLPEFWGLGYALEASSFCVSYALNTLNNNGLYAGHHPDNQKSAKLLQKLSFKQIDSVYYEPTGLIHPFYKYEDH